MYSGQECRRQTGIKSGNDDRHECVWGEREIRLQGKKRGKERKKQNEKITDVRLSVCLQRENHLMDRGHKRGFSFHFLATVRRFCLQNQCFQHYFIWQNSSILSTFCMNTCELKVVTKSDTFYRETFPRFMLTMKRGERVS